MFKRKLHAEMVIEGKEDPEVTFPHCEPRVLHKPDECFLCAEATELQEEREVLDVSNTGHSNRRFPCPADAQRGSDHLLWGGNRPKSRELPEDRQRHWDLRMLDLAQTVAGWSKDPRTKVGAVIVDGAHRVASHGYNGFPRGVSDEPRRYNDPDTKYKLIVHAEVNAILNAHRELDILTLYCTKYPCSDCTKAIIQVGIARVVTFKQPNDSDWSEDARWSELMLDEAGIRVTEY